MPKTLESLLNTKDGLDERKRNLDADIEQFNIEALKTILDIYPDFVSIRWDKVRRAVHGRHRG